MKKYQLIIFDWDGTLMDSTDLITKCVQNAFSDLNFTIPKYQQAKNIIGLGLKEAIIALKPDANQHDINCISDAYRYYFFKSKQNADNLFDGVLDTLAILKQEQYKLAIATGKSRRGLDKVLSDTNLSDFFDSSRCADETESKPNPLMLQEILDELLIRPEHSLLIGDTEYDLAMANKINMPALAVSFGAHNIERLTHCKPQGFIDNIQQLLDYL